MKKEQLTMFDLEAAFKALDEIDIPKAEKGIRANKEDLKESFKDYRRSRTDLLMEDYYDISDTADLEEAKAEREAEVAKAKLARIEKIVDLEAESEEDLLPSYVGKMIIQCPQCMTLFYKNEEDVVKSETDEETVNEAEVCQHCGNDAGYTLIGKVEGVKEEEVMSEEQPEEEASAEEETVDFEATEEENTEEPELEAIPDEEAETTEEESEDIDLEEIPVEEGLKLHEAKLTEDEEPQEEQQEESQEETQEETPVENSNEQEAEKMFQDLKDANSYTEFVKILAKDVKSQAFINYLNQHYKNGDDAIKTVKQANASYGKCKCSQLIPTQQNISLKKSLGLVAEPGWSEKIINTPLEAFNDPTIIYAGKYIIDGHHRWSRIYALNGGDSELKVLNFPEISGVSWKDMLKATQLAIVSDNPEAPLINKVDEDNMLQSSKEEIKNYVIGKICDEVVNALKAKGRGEDKESVSDKISDNVMQMQSTSQPAEGAAPREVMPQTDRAPGSIDKLKGAVIDLTEAVDKDLQDKLDAHNEYIKFLQEEIDKEEKALESAKNDFIKEAIQRRLDALKADLEAALPEEVKNTVEAEAEAPVEVEEPVEADVEVAEESEEKAEDTVEEVAEIEEVEEVEEISAPEAEEVVKEALTEELLVEEEIKDLSEDEFEELVDYLGKNESIETDVDILKDVEEIDEKQLAESIYHNLKESVQGLKAIKILNCKLNDNILIIEGKMRVDDKIEELVYTCEGMNVSKDTFNATGLVESLKHNSKVNLAGIIKNNILSINKINNI